MPERRLCIQSVPPLLSITILFLLFSACCAGDWTNAKRNTKVDLYKLLGIASKTPAADIKKVCRKLSLQYHPDKNKEEGAEEKFIEISNACQVLLDEKKRKAYDQGGMDWVEREERGGGFTDPFDFFRQWSGFNGGKRQAPATRLPIYLSLEEIALGTRVSVEVNKQLQCKTCNGCGAKNPNDIQTCDKCSGRGVVVQVRQIAPGFIQQFQSACDKCSGKGQVAKSVCTSCKGKKFDRGNAQVNVEVRQGCPQGYEIVLDEAGDWLPEHEAGDLIFVVHAQPHAVFTRKGDNLYASITITLDEALDGFTRSIKHLDGELVQIVRTKTTQPGFTLVVPQRGMPIFDGYGHGDLFVQVNVLLPENAKEWRGKAQKGTKDREEL